jgi:hypothetical protein
LQGLQCRSGYLQQGGFTGAGRADHRGLFTRRELEREIGQRQRTASTRGVVPRLNAL